MQRKYENFEEREMIDGTYLVGEPSSPADERIRIDTGWFEGEAGEKRDWEYIVGEIVANDLQEDLQLEEGGEGTITRERAVENINNADIGGDKSVVNRDQAEAIVDYFVEEGALTQRHNEEMVVLHDPTKLTSEDSQFDDQEREYHILSWAAAIDTCIDHMQDTLDTFRDARERLQQETEDIGQEEVSHVEKELARVAQELKALGPGADVPDRSDLARDERNQFDTLKDDLAYYKSLHEVKKEQLVTAEKGIEQLKQNIRRLRAAKDTYESKVGEMRKAALRQQVFPSEDVDLAKNMAGLITSLSNAENPEKMADSWSSTEDVQNAVDEALEDVGEVVDEIETSVDEEELDEAEAQAQEGIQME